MHEQIIKNADEIVSRGGGTGINCVLALLDFDGSPTASTITISKADGIRRLMFCTGLRSTKALRIAKCNRASVCFSTDDYNITLVGSIKVLIDHETKKEMWYPGLRDHFAGYDDPNYCVLEFTAERYNLLVGWEEASGMFNNQ